MGLAGGEHVVFRHLFLHHAPHALDIVAGKAPVARRIEIADLQDMVLAQRDAGERQRHLAGDELTGPQGGFMVE